MSGRRIDDHSFWAGGKSKSSVFPEGVHTKQTHSEEGSGTVARYEDTDERIKAMQAGSKSKVKSHGMKEGYRY